MQILGLASPYSIFSFPDNNRQPEGNWEATGRRPLVQIKTLFPSIRRYKPCQRPHVLLVVRFYLLDFSHCVCSPHYYLKLSNFPPFDLGYVQERGCFSCRLLFSLCTTDQTSNPRAYCLHHQQHQKRQKLLPVRIIVHHRYLIVNFSIGAGHVSII